MTRNSYRTYRRPSLARRVVEVAAYGILASMIAGGIVAASLAYAPRKPLAVGEYGRPVCVTGIAMPAEIVLKLAARRCRAARLACKMQDA